MLRKFSYNKSIIYYFISKGINYTINLIHSFQSGSVVSLNARVVIVAFLSSAPLSLISITT